MFFLFFILITFSKFKKENPIKTPESFPISVSTKMMKITGNPICDQIVSDNYQDNFDVLCWSNDGNATFSYTFKGVQFLIYGKQRSFGKFNLLFDNEDIGEIIETSNNKNVENLLYTSRIYKYGYHKIQAIGQKGQYFEILKFAFWPEFKVKRLNISDMYGNFFDEIYEYKNQFLKTSKIWIYGTIDPNYGKLHIMLNEFIYNIEIKGPHEDCKLLFESDEINFTFDNMFIVLIQKKSVSVCCIYYLFDLADDQTLHANERNKIEFEASIYEKFSYFSIILIGIVFTAFFILIFLFYIRKKRQQAPNVIGLRLVNLNHEHICNQSSNEEDSDYSDHSEGVNGHNYTLSNSEDGIDKGTPINVEFSNKLPKLKSYDMILPQSYIDKIAQEAKMTKWIPFPLRVIVIFKHEINKLNNDEEFIAKFTSIKKEKRYIYENDKLTYYEVDKYVYQWIKHFFPTYIFEEELDKMIKFFYDFVNQYGILKEDCHDIFCNCMNVADQVASNFPYLNKKAAYYVDRLEKDS